MLQSVSKKKSTQRRYLPALHKTHLACGYQEITRVNLAVFDWIVTLGIKFTTVVQRQ